MPNKIILPGGAGLVGQNLLPRLKAAGFTEIVVLDKHAANLAALHRRHPDVTAECVDLAEAGDWQRHFEGAAAVVMLQAQIGGPVLRDFVRNNVDATRHVLDAMKQHRVPRLVHISSSVVESVANDFYTDTKKQQETLVLQATADSGIECPVLRPTLMFGWFDRKHLGWLSRFMARVPVFPIPGDGRYMRQPLYAGDFCKVIVSCVEGRVTRGTHNISGREKIDYIDIIREIKRATRARALIVTLPYALFHAALWTWGLFDRNPPFTTQQLRALVAKDEFELIDWPARFGVTATPFAAAIDETFNDPTYGHVALDF